jgi:F0F1-type ATP synthase membrane subunit b/b'
MEFSFNENQSVDSDQFATVVPADFQGLYVEKDGKHVLDTENPVTGAAVSAVTRLNKSLVASRAEAKALKGKTADLSVLSEFGDTPEAILEGMQGKIDEIKAASKTKGGEELERRVSKIKEDLQTAHNSEKEGLTKRIEALTGQLYEHLVTSAATSALAEAKAIDVDLVLPHLVGQIKVSEEDGKFVVNVVDGAGDPRYSGTTGAPMTVDELVGEMKGNKKYEPLFASEAHTGGGGQPTHRAGVRVPQGEKTSLQKIAAGVQQGGTGNRPPAGMK